MWDLSLENFDNILLVWIKFNFLLKLLFNHATLEKKKVWVVWNLSLENFDNKLLVWIEFELVLNYF